MRNPEEITIFNRFAAKRKMTQVLEYLSVKVPKSQYLDIQDIEIDTEKGTFTGTFLFLNLPQDEE